jgi:hypothetical protein
MQILDPEAGQPIPMLHNDHTDRRVRQDPGQLRTFAVQSGTDVAERLRLEERAAAAELALG